jgi:hypothetical protein
VSLDQTYSALKSFSEAVQTPTKARNSTEQVSTEMLSTTFSAEFTTVYNDY